MENFNGYGSILKIIQCLDEEGAFLDVVHRVIRDARAMIKATRCVILQISTDKNFVNTIAECHSDDVKDIKVENIPLAAFTMCNNLPHMYNRIDNREHEKLFEMYDTTEIISVPIVINQETAMYLLAMTDGMRWTSEEYMFVQAVGEIIQSIAQKKVINNSLISSYEAMKGILSKIGCALIVSDYMTGEELFENNIARESEENRRVLKEAVEKVFHAEPFVVPSKPIETYDAESGLWFMVTFSTLNWIDGSKAVLCYAKDITVEKKNRQKIEFQAHNDFLTGLYNRMKCEEDLKACIEKCVAKKKKGAVLFIDLDNFKHINDGLGHQYGDVLLQQISVGLQNISGLRGNCYRMGGDEFVAIVTPEVFHLLERIIINITTMFNKPWLLIETEYYCTMSMGVVVFPDNGSEVNELIKKADIAMYDAKKDGKNGYRYYSDEKENVSAKRLDVENNMRQAVAEECEEFTVYYQPIVEAATGKCVSCEALVRWNSKAFGFLGPGEFIPMAEYLGLITNIGDYVLEEACRQCKEWNESGNENFRVNVNLSVIQLLQKDVVENIKSIVEKVGVNPKNITLEITENLAIEDLDRVERIMQGIKKLGIKMALDDFGTGYSSLNYVKQLSFDIIKIDKSFVDDVTEDGYEQAFVKLIIELCKTIGAKVCVEGVENLQQFELLRDMSADLIQGYYFDRPLPAQEFRNKFLK